MILYVHYRILIGEIIVQHTLIAKISIPYRLNKLGALWIVESTEICVAQRYDLD